MEQIKLSPRLQAIANRVPLQSSVVDVGTDHGYIPIWLAQKGTYGALAASDIHEGPLATAQKDAEHYGVADEIRFFRCDGLTFPGSDEFQTVLIAGMGGETIRGILESAPWTKDNRTLILQPNSKIEFLHEWLEHSGYTIQDVQLVRDSGRIYQILQVGAGNGQRNLTLSQRMVDPMYLEKKDPLLNEYLQILIGKYQKSYSGMQKGTGNAAELQQTEQILQDLDTMRKECAQWQQ